MPILALIFGVWAMLLASPASAHQSIRGHAYDPWCCNGGDCHELPPEAVTAGPDGWIVILRKGEHPMVTSPEVRHVIPYGKERPATDGRFHLCLYPTEDTTRCFYAPPSGS